MRTQRIIVPKPTWDGHLKLDMRIVPLLHKELAQVINDSVERTQKPFMKPLPDQLIVTQKQHASLNNFTQAMSDTEDRIYLTPWNVMEVHVDREHVADDPEVQQTIAWIDELTELEAEHDEQQLDTHGSNTSTGR